MPISPQACCEMRWSCRASSVCRATNGRRTDGQTDGHWRVSWRDGRRHYASFAMFSQAPQRPLCCEMSFGRRLAVNTSWSPVVSSGQQWSVWDTWHGDVTPLWVRDTHRRSSTVCPSVCLSLPAISSSRISSVRTMDVSPRYWVNELHGRLTLTSRHHSTQSTNRQTHRQTDRLPLPWSTSRDAAVNDTIHPATFITKSMGQLIGFCGFKVLLEIRNGIFNERFKNKKNVDKTLKSAKKRGRTKKTFTMQTSLMTDIMQ